MSEDRIIVKSVNCDGLPYTFWQGGTDIAKKDTARTKKRAVWTVVFRGRTRRIVTTLERGLQERGLL